MSCYTNNQIKIVPELEKGTLLVNLFYSSLDGRSSVFPAEPFFLMSLNKLKIPPAISVRYERQIARSQ